jgi:dethiobiotin synthetase
LVGWHVTRSLFITGTDTGVGKTVVAAALAVAFRRRELRVGVLKPVESGCPTEGGRPRPLDALFLRDASGCAAPLETINPYALSEPLAPALAAERAGIAIDLGRIEQCFQTLAASHDIVLVEGAGGVLSPLYGDLTMLDIAIRLALPVLIVAANVLGVINHSALTVGAIEQRGLRVLGIVLNDRCAERDSATGTNEGALRRWGGAEVLATLPYVASLDNTGLNALAGRVPAERLLEATLTPRPHCAGGEGRHLQRVE